jgi:hypothetical protein
MSEDDVAVDPAVAEFANIIVDISKEFDEECDSRHRKGGLKYGPGKFLTVDTIQEALNEIIDLSNYARYTYIKLRLLQESIMQQLPAEEFNTGFVKSKQTTTVRDQG